MIRHANKKKSEQTARPNKYPQGRFNDKPCRECGELFPPISPSNLYCSDSCADKGNTRNYLRNNYQITLEEYLEMFEKSDGKCDICNREGFKMNVHQRTALVIDHCHDSLKVRGLLCNNCNRALGLLQDDVERLKSAICYLERATTIPQGSTSQAIGDGSAQHSTE
jgi:hypothetical protein